MGPGRAHLLQCDLRLTNCTWTTLFPKRAHSEVQGPLRPGCTFFLEEGHNSVHNLYLNQTPISPPLGFFSNFF